MGFASNERKHFHLTSSALKDSSANQTFIYLHGRKLKVVKHTRFLSLIFFTWRLPSQNIGLFSAWSPTPTGEQIIVILLYILVCGISQIMVANYVLLQLLSVSIFVIPFIMLVPDGIRHLRRASFSSVLVNGGMLPLDLYRKSLVAHFWFWYIFHVVRSCHNIFDHVFSACHRCP